MLRIHDVMLDAIEDIRLMLRNIERHDRDLASQLRRAFFPACGAPLPPLARDAAHAPTVLPAATWADAPRAREMAAAGQSVLVALDGPSPELLEACTRPATYAVAAEAVDPASTGYTLSSFQDNLTPPEASCTRATHVMTRITRDSAELSPLARPQLAEATLVAIDPPPGEAWTLRASDTAIDRICVLPCARWMRPHSVHEIVRDGAAGRVLVFGPAVPEPDLHLVVGKKKDALWPWLGIVVGAFGAGATVASIALAPSSSGGGSSGSSSGSSGGSSGDILGFLVVGALALGLDVWSVFYLAAGPSYEPALVPLTTTNRISR